MGTVVIPYTTIGLNPERAGFWGAHSQPEADSTQPLRSMTFLEIKLDMHVKL